MTDIRPREAGRKTALAPDLRRLDDRAARAWTERMAVRPRGGAEYAVESESGATYVVDLETRTCTCPDHRIRAETCKHMRRVAIEISARRVPPPGKRRASCAACGVETFVDGEADRREGSERASGETASSEGASPPLCETCRLEPGDVVRDRREAPDRQRRVPRAASRGTDDRLVVVRVTQERADEVTITAADCTVAAYETNEDYPDDDPVVEAVYLGSLGRADDLSEARRYSFPLSRLARVDDAAVVDTGLAPEA
ncbi:MAG: SWIM zinc finger family protein [Haloarculaceae archaeon]